MKNNKLSYIRILTAYSLPIVMSLIMVGPASAQGPGLYKDGRKIADLSDLGAPPLESLTSASAGPSAQIQELRRRVQGTQEPSDFREQ